MIYKIRSNKTGKFYQTSARGFVKYAVSGGKMYTKRGHAETTLKRENRRLKKLSDQIFINRNADNDMELVILTYNLVEVLDRKNTELENKS